MDDDEDVPQLSVATLAALSEFYQEQAARQEAEAAADGSGDMPQEDWQLSQFWYSKETAQALAQEAISAAGDQGKVACISCPTLYHKLCEVKPASLEAKILEYDQRFKSFGEDFVFYDYNHPTDLPENFEHAFDLVIADPPFLSEECLTKTVETVNYLAKEKVLVCTGAVMMDCLKGLMDVERTKFTPRHENNLSNEFCCYANYKTVYL